MPSSLELFKRFPNPHFCETGTHRGNGVALALEAGFEDCRSIELHAGNYEACKERFKDDCRVKLYFGDSSKMLSSMISDISEPITFFLDAHFSGEGTANGTALNPIHAELEQIALNPWKAHVIIIDDWRCYGGGASGEKIRAQILAINPAYQFEELDDCIARNDILVARIP